MVVAIKNIIKIILPVFLFLLAFGTIQGQETDTLSLGESEQVDTLPKTKGKVMETRWMMLDMGWNSFIYKNTNIDNSPLELNGAKSFQFNLNIFRQRISLYKRKLNLEYGFVLDFNRYELKNPYTLSPYSTAVDPVFIDTTTYKRNSLHTASLTIPLLFQFESNPSKKKKSFHVGAGGYFGLIVGSKNKQRTITGGKLNTKGDFNLPYIKYGLQAELGFSYFTVIYKLELSPFFIPAQDAGYRLQAMTIGVRLIPYF
jgi:hypothetical protein